MSDLIEHVQMADVSVIIPCYRCSATIERAVASVRNQTLIPAEVILVDDYSCDGTIEILREVQHRYPADWVKVLQLPKNGGPGTARNAGWDIALQPYIAFLDADDSWHPQKLDIQYNWMKAHPAAAITGHQDVIQDGAMELGVYQSFEEPRRVPFWLLLISNRFPTRSVMLRRELTERFVDGMRYSEDYCLWLHILARGQSGYRFTIPLAVLYKEQYGDAGLSANLWKLAKGEIHGFSLLRRECLIGKITFYLVSCGTLAKYVRRLLISTVRRFVNKQTRPAIVS